MRRIEDSRRVRRGWRACRRNYESPAAARILKVKVVSDHYSTPIRNQQEAAQRLGDAEYFAWCEGEARKLFEALVARRWPKLVPPRRGNIPSVRPTRDSLMT